MQVPATTYCVGDVVLTGGDSNGGSNVVQWYRGTVTGPGNEAGNEIVGETGTTFIPTDIGTVTYTVKVGVLPITVALDLM